MRDIVSLFDHVLAILYRSGLGARNTSSADRANLLGAIGVK